MQICSNAIEGFFSDMAAAIEQQDKALITRFFRLPAVLVTEQERQVCYSAEQVWDVYQQRFDWMLSAGQGALEAKILHQVRLAESVIYCRVNWLTQPFGGAVKRCACSYTLKIDESGGFRVIVLVIDKQQMSPDRIRLAS